MDGMENFRKSVRDWLETNCPPGMRDNRLGGDYRCWGGREWEFDSLDQKLWMDRCVDKGWTVPTWPVEYGGAGLSKLEAAIIKEEMVSLGIRTPLYSYGITMLGPALLKYGTDAQKTQHLPKIARGDIRWCQGYSEPGAGSDLASLKMKCEDKGDYWLINGQKIWTSAADKSDWIFALVRTDNSGRKHEGITFILMDMMSEGLSARPIELISGASPFCETFFEDVVVPKNYGDNNPSVVGNVGDGWSIGMYLLTHERGSLGGYNLEGRNDEKPILEKAIHKFDVDEKGRLDNPLLRAKLVKAQIDDAAYAATVDLMNERVENGQEIGAQSSIVKFYSTQIIQRGYELRMDIAGSDSLVSKPEANQIDENAELTQNWLYSRAYSILGGTSEIQLNIIAKRVLELPSR